MGGFVAVGLEPEIWQDWELGAVGVCASTFAVGDQLRTTTWYVRDADGRLIREVRAQPGRPPDLEVDYAYDAHGWIASAEEFHQTDGKLHRSTATEYQHDTDGRIRGVHRTSWLRAYATTDPDTDTWTSSEDTSAWTLDKAGRVVRQGDAAASHTEITRDAHGRMTAVTNVTVWTPLAVDVDAPVPGPQTRREPFDTVAWSADGRGAVETIYFHSEPRYVSTWTFDADGVPLTSTTPVDPPLPEVVTWYRDCSGLPPVPARSP